MMRLLSDLLPLRVAADLPRYRADAGSRVLPWVYGRASVAPVPLDDAGLEWLVADHPVVAVERVRSAGKDLDGWQLVQRLDETGRAIATVRLTRAPEGLDLSVQLVGRRHEVSGGGLEHPAEIAADLLRQCGWSPAPDAFQGLHDDFPGLALAMVFAERSMRLREAVAAVIEPLGAVWFANPPTARRRAFGGPVAVLGVHLVDEVFAESNAGDLATLIRADFAFDWASGASRQSVTVQAPDAAATYGHIEVALDLGGVRTARDALAITRGRLEMMARPGWTVRATVPVSMQIALGDTVTLDHPRVPRGDALVIATSRDLVRGALELVCRMPAGAAPRLVLVQRAQAFDQATADNSVTYKDGVATFTLTDDAGNPLVGASVTLDGAETRETDSSGRVQFRTTRGAHSLLAYLSGFAPFELEVFV